MVRVAASLAKGWVRGCACLGPVWFGVAKSAVRAVCGWWARLCLSVRVDACLGVRASVCVLGTV